MQLARVAWLRKWASDPAMHPLVVTAIVFACVFGGALAGMFVRGRLPPHHVSRDARRIVKMAMGTVAALIAVVLGLLVSSAKTRFDDVDTEVTQSCAKLLLLDRMLARYGPETRSARSELRAYLARKLEQRWPRTKTSRSTALAASDSAAMHFQNAQGLLLALAPANAVQRRLQSRALDVLDELARTRWLLFEQSAGSSIPTPFLVILVFWATVLFTSFGLFAPHNGTVLVALWVSALSVACAVFLVLQMERPFGGVIEVSSALVRRALAQLGS